MNVTSDGDDLSEGKTYDNKSNTLLVSRDNKVTWKFLPVKYYIGFGETENGLGLVNKHPEVLPPEVWDHFYLKLDPKTSK